MQSPIRALLYGIAIWFVWVSLVVFSAEILPSGISGLPLFVSMQMAALAALVLGFTILYLRKVGEGSIVEGLLVGLSWAVVMIAIDLAHSVVMPDMVPDIDTYFTTVVRRRADHNNADDGLPRTEVPQTRIMSVTACRFLSRSLKEVH